MVTLLYEISINALIVVTFFTFVGYLVGCQLKDRPFVSDSYMHSRYWMAGAMFLLFILALLHNGYHLRLKDNFTGAAITLCFFYFVSQLYAYADLSLSNPGKLNTKRYGISLIAAVLYVGIFGCAYHFMSYIVFQYVTIILGILYLGQTMYMTVEYFTNFKRIANSLSNYYAEDYESYIKWMPRCMFMLGMINFLAPFLLFLPIGPVAIFNFSIAFVLFWVFVCYERYIIYERYCHVAVKTIQAEEAVDSDEENGGQQSYSDELIRVSLQRWVDEKAFCQNDVTIMDLCKYVGTNRTYLSKYINSVYGLSFRNWVAELRVEEAKKMLVKQHMSLTEMSACLGFSSSSAFSRTFTQLTGVTPTTYRKNNKYKIEAI